MNQTTTLTSTGGTITFGGNATNNAAGAGITVDAPIINLTGGTTVATTGNGPINFFTDTLNPNGASINVGTGAFSLSPNVLTRTIEFGDVDTGRVTDVYYGSNFAGVTAGSFTIGRPTHTGNIFVTGVAAAPSAINVVNGGAGSVIFENAPYVSGNQDLGAASGSGGIAVNSSLTIGTGVLRLTTSGAITQTAGAITANIAGLSAGTGITLAQPANNVTTLAAQTTAGNISFTDTDSFSIGSVSATVDGFHPAITDFTANAGTITLQSGGPVTQTQRILASALSLQGSGPYQLTNGANDVTSLVANTTGNVQYNDATALVLGPSTVSGSFDVTTGGAITQSGAVTVTGTTTLAAGAANDITLTNAGNNFSTVGIASGNNVTLNDTSALILGASTVSGTLGITTNGVLTQSGVLTVTGVTTLSAGGNDITLTNAGNDFSSVGITSGNTVSLTDTNALALSASTVSGNLALTTGGPLSQTGTLVVTGTTSFTATAANTDILLDTQANNFGGAVAFGGTQTNFRDVQLRNINVGATVPVLASLTNLRNLTLTFDSAAMTVPTLLASGNVNLTAGGSINQSGAVTVGGTTVLATTVAGSDFLFDTQANNFVGAVSFGGTVGNIRDVGVRNINVGATVPVLAGLTNLRNLTLTFDTAAIALPALTLTAGGSLNVTAGGSITETGAITVPGTTTLATTVAGSDILLNAQANNFGGAVSFGGTQSNIRDVGLRNINVSATVPALAGLTNLRNLTLQFDSAPVTLPTLTLTAGGSLNVTAGGAITDSGNLIVPGTTTLAAGANDIALDNANNFIGAVSIASANNVTLNDINALVLGASTVSGALNVTTNGALTQSGPLTVVGITTLASGANDITLTNAGNDFSNVGITSGNNVSLTDTNALVLGASTVSGNLALTTGGTLLQTGALAVTGTTSFTATVANTDILLDTQANNFGGVVGFAGTQTNLRDVQLRNVNAGATVPVLAGLTNLRNLTLTFDNAPITLPALTASGNLNITAGGLINQSGAVAIGGTTALVTTVAGSDILLDTQANNFGGAVGFGGTQTNIRDIGLRNLNVGATIPALAGVTNLRNLTLTFDNASIALPALTLTAGGNLNVTAAGSVTETGAITVPGTTTLATTIAGSDVLLHTQANNFGGAVSFGGTQSNIRDLGLRNVNVGATVPVLAGLTSLRNLTLTFDNAPMVLTALTASGNLTAAAGGLISQSGALTVAGNAAFDTTAAATLGSVILANGGALTLGTSTVGGNLTVTTAAGDLTLPVGQTLTVVGDATLTPAGNVSLLGTTRIGGTQSSIGGVSSAFVLGADTNLNALPLPGTGNITVTTTGTTATFAGAPLLPQAINLNNASNTFGGSVSATTAAPAFTGTTTNTYNLSQSAPVSVNPGQSLTITDLGGTAGTRGNVTLTNPANNFDLVNVTGGNIALAETGPVTIGTVSANTGTTSTGTLSITSTGAITQTGAIVAASTTTLTAGVSDITLTNAGNNFSAVGVTSGNSVTLTDSTALVLGTSSVSGNFAVTTGGTLTQSGALTVTGTTTLGSTAANSDILLDTQANTFGGGVAFGGTQTNIRDVSLRNVNAGATIPVLAGLTNLRNLVLTFDAAPINLPALNASGNLSATAGGSITQSGALTIGGATTLATTVASSDILLDTQANNFGGTVAFGGTQTNIRDFGLRNLDAGATIPALAGVTNLRNLTLMFDNGPIVLPSLAASGNLTATAGGTITQIGALTIAGISTLAAGANNITLTDAANNFSTVGITSGNNISLTDANTLTINTSNVSGNIAINANDLTIGGPVVSTGGDMTLTAVNTVAQSANLTANGDVVVTATTGSITMASTATTTSVTGAIGYTAGTNVTLGSLAAGGAVNVIANGGSIFSADGPGTNVTAGANSRLLAFNGVVGTQAAPMTVIVNGTLSILATSAVAGISAFLMGTVQGNTLTLLNVPLGLPVPPGLVCFNGCPVGGVFGLTPSFSYDSIVPWYLHEPSDPPMISVFATYLPKSVVTEAEVDMKSNEKSVSREIPPCFPASACKPAATSLTTPVERDGVTAR
jgi:hypothetical protein